MSNISIHVASMRGDLAMIKAMAEEDPFCINTEDQFNWPPIFHAAMYQQRAAVKLLIKLGADVTAQNGDVLHYAGEVPDNKAMVQLLIDQGALQAYTEPMDDLQRQFLVAVFMADVHVLNMMMDIEPGLVNSRDIRCDQPIHHAARNGDLEIVKALVEAGANVNARGHKNHTVLYCAGGHAHLDVSRYLINQGADIDATFGEQSTTLSEWLAQYASDKRYHRIAALLTA